MFKSSSIPIRFATLAMNVIVVTTALPTEAAVQFEGIIFEGTMRLDGQPLELNGIGMGQQLTEKVFVSGLYLPSEKPIIKKDFATIAKMPGAKRIETVYLRKTASSNLSRFLTKAMRASTDKEALNSSFDALLEFGRQFSSAGDRVAGDRVTMDWIPAKGFLIQINEKPLGEPIKSEAIFRLLLEVHIGPAARERLRDGLLGIVQNGTLVEVSSKAVKQKK
jgi:Chalcone isomerase-like